MKRTAITGLLAAAALGAATVGTSTAAPPIDASRGTGTGDSGAGIAPGAPAWVRQHVADVKAGVLGRLGQADVPAADYGHGRSLAGAKRMAAWGCWGAWGRRNYDNWPWGYNYFRYYEQVTWCGNGWSQLTSFWRDRWPEVNFPGWSFQGHVGSNCDLEHCNGRGSGQYSTDAWTMGQFALCAAWCFDHKYPWVDIYVTADGDWSESDGGT
jgi:hypothetical protein